MAKVYLAGPLGFTEAGQYFHETVLRPAVESAGHEVLDPWEYSGIRWSMMTDPTDPAELDAFNRDVGAMNESMIREADILLAVLDGSDVDSGTAAEIGFAAAIGKPIVGLRTDKRMSGDDKATAFNLQVAHFIRRSGGEVVKTLDEGVRVLRGAINS